MSPEVQAELDRLLVRIAFDWWKSEPGDQVETWSDWDKGYRYSEYTGEPASMTLSVTVKRADYNESMPYTHPDFEENERKKATRIFSNEEVAALWGEVMG